VRARVQEEYRHVFIQSRPIEPGTQELFTLYDFDEPSEANHEAAPVVLVGDVGFIKKSILTHEQAKHRVLVSGESLDAEELSSISQGAYLYVVPLSDQLRLKQALQAISERLHRESQVAQIKSEIQKKRKTLEQLNQRLANESEEKVQSLEKLHLEESEKNQNEKSLLHFLDFIQSESIGDDFLEKIFRFIWKDLKKMSRLHLIGLCINTSANKSKILFYDGVAESASLGSVDFSGAAISHQLAALWGRPVGRIVSWQLPEISRESYLFVEIVEAGQHQYLLDGYVAERIAVLSMYIDRWMIEKEIEVVVERWRNTFSSFSGYAHVIDQDFRIYQANYPHSEGQHCYEALAGRKQVCDTCPVLQNKNSSFILKDEMSVKTFYSQFKFQDRKYYFVIYEDTTKLNQLQSHIFQTEKMSTLGRLGNHLAHELNNPLTGIKSYVQTLLSGDVAAQDLPATAQSDLQEILKATIRCQKIIKNFIDFSQKQEPNLELVDFSEVVQNTLVLLKTALRSHRLFIDLKKDIVRANAHDLQQVLFNLIRNSCQAMSDGGTVKITREESPQHLIFHVEDSGPGFAPHILKNIFQPFMTTKQHGEGTGLGLYLSKKLMNNMGADLQISSSGEKGAKISLIFARV
jgi:two-component system NtrC family sensor kinase